MAIVFNAPITGNHVLIDGKLTVSVENQQRRARIQAENARVTSYAWLERQFKEIKAQSEKDAWRPHVSNSKGQPAFSLAYWTLGRANSDEWYPEGQPSWRTYRRLYDNGWCGITISDYSQFEYDAMVAFATQCGKKNCRQYLPEQFEQQSAGIDYGEYSTGFWFKKLEDHNTFVEILEGFPKRDIYFLLGEAHDLAGIEHLLAGENYRIVKGMSGREKVLSMQDGNKAILARMFCG